MQRATIDAAVRRLKEISEFRKRRLQSWPCRVRNQARQRLSPQIKIFVIGFNKCGTRSLHMLFKRNDIRSAHWSVPDGRNVALTMAENLKCGRSILWGLESFTAFSDLTFYSDTHRVEACTFFERMHEQFPESYFIFNTRPVERWIHSRLVHENEFARRAAGAYDCAIEDLPAKWTSEFDDHHAKVLSFFAGRSERLCVFDIEHDDVGKVIRFLRPHFKIKGFYWQHRGKSQPAPAAPDTALVADQEAS
jgi:sulfotransferase family protein